MAFILFSTFSQGTFNDVSAHKCHSLPQMLRNSVKKSGYNNPNFTFKSKEKSVSEIIRFALNIIVCYVLAYGIAKRLAFLVLGFLFLGRTTGIWTVYNSAAIAYEYSKVDQASTYINFYIIKFIIYYFCDCFTNHS